MIEQVQTRLFTLMADRTSELLTDYMINGLMPGQSSNSGDLPIIFNYGIGLASQLKIMSINSR